MVPLIRSAVRTVGPLDRRLLEVHVCETCVMCVCVCVTQGSGLRPTV